MLREIVRDDRNEAGREPALRDEGGGRIGRQLSHDAGARHVFRQIEVVGAAGLGRLGDARRQVEGRRAQDGELAG